MANKVSVYRDDDGNFSAVCGLGILCQSASRDDCEAALLAALDVTPGEVSAWLDNPASAGEFRPAWNQAVGSTLVTLATAMERQSADAKISDALLATISGQLQQILDGWRQQQIQDRITKLQVRLLRQLDDAKARLAGNGISDATDDEILQLWATSGDALVNEIQQLLLEVKR